MREIRIDDETNARLDELQAEIRRQTGQSVTKREVLTQIIDTACESPKEIVDSFRDSAVPLSASEKATMRSGRIASGTATDEDDIDDILYSGP